MGSGGYNWIDKPFLDAIEYFSGLFAYYAETARSIGSVMCILSIVWFSVQMIFGTMEVRKAVTGIITKFILFLLVLNLYWAIVGGVKAVALKLGSMGVATESITTGMTGFMRQLEQLVEQEDISADEELAAATAVRDKLLKDKPKFNWGPESHLQGVNVAELRVAEARRRAEARRDNPDGNQKTLTAIKSILKPVGVDGETEGGNYTRQYFLDIELKSAPAGGEPTGFLSPSAVLRVVILTALIMWEKEWETITTTMDEKAEKGGWFAKAIPASNFEMHWLFDMLLTFICMLLLVIATIFALCQYAMTIIEYCIISSVAILFVPMLLFDGLKDMANKVIPAIMGLSVKLMIITLCMYYSIYAYLGLAMDVITENSSFNLQMFGYIAFTVLLTFILTQNAPQIAVTMLTGNPQLSMGELVHALGTAAALGGGAVAAARAAPAFAGGATRGAMNVAGNAAALHGAYTGAAGAAKEAGLSGGQQIAAGLKGMAGETGSTMKRSLARAGSDVAHAGMNGKGGRGGGSGGGAGYNRLSDDAAHSLSKEELKSGEDKKLGLKQHRYGSALNANGQAMTAKEFTGGRRQEAFESARKNFKAPPPKPPEARKSSYTGGGPTPNEDLLASLALGQPNEFYQ
jgi:type IV secretion system protein TrbL